MVTTGTGEIAVVTGAAAGQRNDTASDNSVFAQLLGDAATAAPTAGATQAKSGNGKTANSNNRSETGTEQTTQSAADILALCGLPVTTPSVTAADCAATADDTAANSADTSAQPSTVDLATLALSQAALQVNAEANTQINVLAGVQGEGAAAAAAQTQIKSALSQVAVSVEQTTRPSLQQSAQATVQQAAQQVTQLAAERLQAQTLGDAAAVEVPVLPDSAATTPEQQAAFQKLLAQATPMVGVMTAQLREAGVDASAREAASDAADAVGALNASALQPAGTQLAGDTPVLEVSPRHHLYSQVGTQPWATELGNRLTMMATKDTQSATLYMTPADLGPVQVRIDLNQDQASVWFTAEHAETRSALEQSLPRLREMFTAQGISLTDAGVFGDRSRQQQADSGFTSTGFHSSQYDDSEALADTATVRSISLGLLDTYA